MAKLGRLYGKFPTALTGPEGAIARPPEAAAMRVDGQLVIVIGKPARHVAAADALDYIAGYALGADVSDAAWYKTARLTGRSVDTWAPVGPLVANLDPTDLVVETRVNGRVTERLATRDLVLGIRELVSFFSRYNTLEPGDLIFTGSRAGADLPTAPLQAGDWVEIDGGPLGKLRHRVEHLPAAPSWNAPAPATTTSTRQPAHYVRFATPDGPRAGRVADNTVSEVAGDLLAPGAPTGRTVPLAHAKLLPPLRPRKIIGVILNYFPPGATDRAAPIADLPAKLFLKWPDNLGTTGDAIELPPEAKKLNWEGELVAVIGRTARHVPVERALDYVAGYGVGNDISDNLWGGLLGKATATWTQLGPVIATGVAWDQLHITTHLNGQLVQSQGTADLRYGVPLLVAFASRYFTLEPGDLIYTGSAHRIPGTLRPLVPGDELIVDIPGVSSLRNTVIPLRDSRP